MLCQHAGCNTASAISSSPTPPSHHPISSLASPPSIIPHSLQSNTTAAPISIDEDSDDLPRNLNPEPPEKKRQTTSDIWIHFTTKGSGGYISTSSHFSIFVTNK